MQVRMFVSPEIVNDAAIISPSNSAVQLYVQLWHLFTNGITRVPLENTHALLVGPVPYA